MAYLLGILPENLKIQFVKFMNKDVITSIPFLQNRPDTFYLNYMENFH